MNRILASFLMISLSLTSCASYSTYQQSRQMYAQRRAVEPIAEDGVVGVAVNVSSWDVIMEQPWKQFGSALLDGALLYGAYRVGNDLMDDGDSDSTPSDGQVININVRDNQEEVNVTIEDGILRSTEYDTQ